jgi:predicted Zn-ribbon and HTH transcriptional regulator
MVPNLSIADLRLLPLGDHLKSVHRLITNVLTIRQEIIALLSKEEYSARDLSQVLGIREKDVYDHLPHIARSVTSLNKRLMIIPSKCISCGFAFKKRKRFSKPGRCPRCKSQHIIEPRYRIA